MSKQRAAVADGNTRASAWRPGGRTGLERCLVGGGQLRGLRVDDGIGGAAVLGSHGALAQIGSTAAPGRPCTVIQQASVGLDLNLPVGTSLAGAGCDLARDPASAAAAWLAAAGWVLRLLAWAFAALFIAGFTSAVRRT